MIETCLVLITVLLFILSVELWLIFHTGIKIVAHLARRIEDLEDGDDYDDYLDIGPYSPDYSRFNGN